MTRTTGRTGALFAGRGWTLGAASAASCLILAMACDRREAVPGDPHGEQGWLIEVYQERTTKVDLLFVVDNSSSMHEEQSILAEQFRIMAEELVAPTPRPEGWIPPAVGDLHVAVISSDMGTLGNEVATCENPDGGDGGALWAQGRFEGCEDRYEALDCPAGQSCPWLSHSCALPDDGHVTEAGAPIWEDFQCIAVLGEGGCGFEQPLEASLQALTVQMAPGGPAEGFLRDDSLVAVIYVTDEDDCSSPNADFYGPDDETYGPLGVRCAMEHDQLYPLQRYIEGLMSLRPGSPDLVVVAAIAGTPVDGSWDPGDPIEALAALNLLDPENDNHLVPSCETSIGRAAPPVRLAELVYGFGNNGILESICRSDWTAALQAVTRKIQSKLIGRCIVRPLPMPPDGECHAIELLPDDRPCPNPVVPEGSGPDRTGGWHVDLGVNDEGRRRCEILPADLDGDGCPDGDCDCSRCLMDASYGCGCVYEAPSCLQGWFLDRRDCEHGELRLTAPSLTSEDSVVRLECRETTDP